VSDFSDSLRPWRLRIKAARHWSGRQVYEVYTRQVDEHTGEIVTVIEATCEDMECARAVGQELVRKYPDRY
jgi:hypothetical protein